MTSRQPNAGPKEPFSFRYFLKALGPGLITGASDDDPSGIGTYSQAGAQLGYGIGWTMLLSFPLMAAIQEISARRRPRHRARHLRQCVPALFALAAQRRGGAAVHRQHRQYRRRSRRHGRRHQLLIGGTAVVYVLFYGVMSVTAQIFLDYKRYVSVLKWLTLSLFAYVAALAFAHVSWGEALAGVLVPHLTWSADYFTTIVAILGTTISPYLFFWQASQEAEDQRVDATKRPLIDRHYGAQKEFHRIRADTIVGMAFSNLIALAIIITAAATLHAAGKTDIQTSAQAAEALKPIAGQFAKVIFALGISAPACWRSRCSPAPPPMRWAKRGNGRSGWPQAEGSDGVLSVLALSAAIGIALNFTKIDPIGRCTGVRSSTACSPFP